MMTEIRVFNAKGLRAFANLIAEAISNASNIRQATVGEEFLSAVEQLRSSDDLTGAFNGGGLSIDTEKQFETRHEFGDYLSEKLTADDSLLGYENKGLWAWVSAVYMGQLLEPVKGKNEYQLRVDYRYIPIQYNVRRYYKHFAFTSFWISRNLGEMAAQLLLSVPMYRQSGVIEELFTRSRDYLTTPALVEVSVEMYIKPGKGMRKYAMGQKTPGSAYRLARIVSKQLQMNYDLHEMTKDQVYALLPAEFDGWKPQTLL